MRSGEGNENGEKTKIGLISKKATLCVQHTFFVHFFAVVLHDYNVKLPEASWLHVFWRKCRTCSLPLFFHCRSCSPCIGGLQHFLFCQRRYEIFTLFFQQKNGAFVFFPVELCWPVAYFLFFSVFLLLNVPNLWT